MPVKQVVRDALTAGAVLAAVAAATWAGSPRKALAPKVWPEATHAATVPNPLPRGATLVAEYKQFGQTVYCVPYQESSRTRHCSDQPGDFSSVTRPVIVPANPDSPFSPFRQP